MFLKLEVAEEKQMVVRRGVNRGSVLPVAASALEEVIYGRVRLSCRQQVKSGHAL